MYGSGITIITTIPIITTIIITTTSGGAASKGVRLGALLALQ